MATAEETRAKNRAYYLANRERLIARDKAWRAANPDKVNKAQRERYAANNEAAKKAHAGYRAKPEAKAKRREFNAAVYESNKETIKARTKSYREANKDKLRSYHSNLRREKYKTDPEFKLAVLLRGRLRMALRRNAKSGSAVRDLGCTIAELKLYLEAQFVEGMNWDTHGVLGWHIDHIKPLASFDLTDPEQLRAACHYTNLQPLWSEDNLSKGAKLAA